MAGLIVADASALIAYLNPGDAHHADAVQGLIDVDQFVVHPVTLAEVLVHPARSGSESTWWAPRFPDSFELVIQAAVFEFRYSLWTSCGVRYPSAEWRRFVL